MKSFCERQGYLTGYDDSTCKDASFVFHYKEHSGDFLQLSFNYVKQSF